LARVEEYVLVIQQQETKLVRLEFDAWNAAFR